MLGFILDREYGIGHCYRHQPLWYLVLQESGGRARALAAVTLILTLLFTNARQRSGTRRGVSWCAAGLVLSALVLFNTR
jgi:hypothetical protein